MIKELAIKKLADIAFAAIKKTIKDSGFKFVSDKVDIDNAISEHCKIVKNWSSEISFKDLLKPKSTSQVYIELDLYVTPRSTRYSSDEIIQKIPLTKLFSYESNHIILLGQPGAGKTTSMKFTCQQLFFSEENSAPFNLPLLIKLRDFNRTIRKDEKGLVDTGIITEYLFNLFGYKLDFPEGKVTTQSQIDSVKKRVVLETVEKLKALIIIDGFDELAYVTHKSIVLDEISHYVDYLEEARLIMTSRTSDYYYSKENLSVYEVCPLNDHQIKEFALKWLQDKEEADKFMKELELSPFIDTVIRPLTLAHLCAIHERIGRIPDKPKTVYKKIVNLLLEEWDEQRNIKRGSKYARFELDRKFDFLSRIAYELSVKKHGLVFSRGDLELIYNKICSDFDLPKADSKIVAAEIESHTGLLLKAGYDEYEFAHKSLQEFLTAEYIVRLPKIPLDQRGMLQMPNELAVSVSISSNPSLYFSELVFERFIKWDLKFPFIKTFVSRLLIEKPDFNAETNVGISALILYSIYIQESYNIGKQLALFVIDDLTTQFEELIKIVLKRNSTNFIYTYYDEEKTLVSNSGNKIINFTMKKNLVIKEGVLNKLPKSLYCRESFLKPEAIQNNLLENHS